MKKARVLSIIFTSATLAGAALTAGGAGSQTLPLGCFTRVYDQAHLASQPDQVVEAMWLRLWHDPADSETPTFRIGALMANQGHAARDGLGGRIMGEEGYCQGLTCAVYCDGGSFTVTRDTGDMIEITTDHLRVVSEGGCGEGGGVATSLAEVPGQPTTYRLFRSEEHHCERN
ncbi:MAG: hypothetical protein Kow0013_04850 [Pararhodobacter sp.]